MNILVTAGNSQTPIDRVRCITNIFSGRTGAQLAIEAHRRGHAVTLLTSHPEVVRDLAPAIKADSRWTIRPYRTFNDLHAAMAELVPGTGFDALIHAAAVSDYHLVGTYAPTTGAHFDAMTGSWTNGKLTDVSTGKVKSHHPELWLRLTPAPKLADLVRSQWAFRGVFVKFKLEVGISDEELHRIAERSRAQSDADLIVANTLEGKDAVAWISDRASGWEQVSRLDLAQRLIERMKESSPMAIKVSVTVCLIPEAKGGPFVLWDDLPAAARLASELGFDAIELFPPEPDALNPNEVKALLAKHNLAVSAVGSGAGWVRHKLSLTHVDPAHRAKAIAFVRAMIDFAAELNAPVIIGSMQGRWGEGADKQASLAFLAESLNDLGNHAASRGQVLLYEPLNRYETNLINTMADGLPFVRGLQTTNVKLMADLFHMNIEEANIGDAIRAGGKHIGHVHFADSNRRSAGFGHNDFSEVIAALRDIGYDGYLAAEALPYPNPDAAARQTVKRFRELFG